MKSKVAASKKAASAKAASAIEKFTSKKLEEADAVGLYDVGTGEPDPIHSLLQEVRFSLGLLGGALQNVEILVEATPLSSEGVNMSIELMIRKLEAAEKIYIGRRISEGDDLFFKPVTVAS